MVNIEYKSINAFSSFPSEQNMSPVEAAAKILISEEDIDKTTIRTAIDQGIRYFVTAQSLQDFPEDTREKAVVIHSDDYRRAIESGDITSAVERAETRKFLYLPGIDSGDVYDYIATNYPEELAAIRDAGMAGAGSHDTFGTWANVGEGHIPSVFAITHGLMLAAKAPKNKLREADSFAILHDEDKRKSKEMGNAVKRRASKSSNPWDVQHAGSIRDLAITVHESHAEPPYNATSVDLRNYQKWGAIECALRVGDSFTGQHDMGGWKADGPVDPALRIQQLSARANAVIEVNDTLELNPNTGRPYWFDQNHSAQVGDAYFEGRDMYSVILPQVTMHSLEKMVYVIKRRNPGLAREYGEITPENVVTIGLDMFRKEIDEWKNARNQPNNIPSRIVQFGQKIKQRFQKAS